MGFYREDNLGQVTSADLVVGIPSWREESTIAFVAEQAAMALKGYDKTCAIINSDNDSDDNTKASFMKANSRGVPLIYLSSPPLARGKGLNILQIFEKATQLNAQAVAIVEADVTSLRPGWIESLLNPILEGHDLATPLYANTTQQALLTNLLVYPMVRCMWGRRIRQPAGGERAFSAHMVKLLLQQEPWPEIILGHGFDLWSTATAISHNATLCQTFMGSAKVHKLNHPPNFSFNGTIAVLFKLLAMDTSWRSTRWSRPTAIYNADKKNTAKAQDSPVDQKAIAQQITRDLAVAKDFFLHFKETSDLLSNTAPKDDKLLFWAKLLLSAFNIYYRQPQLLEQLISALYPFFLEHLLFFLQQASKMNRLQLDNLIERQCLLFEDVKSQYF